MNVKIKDYKLKPLRKFYRPYFSPKFNSYEMDYASGYFQIGDKKIFKFYLILININTKFLFALPIRDNTYPTVEITKILIKDVNDHLNSLSPEYKINNIRADGDSKFGKMMQENSRSETVRLGDFTYKKNEFISYLDSENISLYLNTSPFVNKNRVVDRVIRTIRDKLDTREHFWLDVEYMALLINEYNHTPHTAFYGKFTPFQVQFTKDLERYFIRENEVKLEKINQIQEDANMKSYEPGNILLIHLDFAKTSAKFNKKRRVFNKLARFISYDFGNVKCFVYNIAERYIKNPVTIPIYNTKFLADNESSIPPKYRELMGGTKN